MRVDVFAADVFAALFGFEPGLVFVNDSDEICVGGRYWHG